MRAWIFMGSILRDRRGASTVEYGIILGMIVFALFAAVAGVGSETSKLWTKVATKTADAQKSN